jgi:hypothetical protein
MRNEGLSTILRNGVLEELVDKNGCHTVILYGSYAAGEETSTSDLDVIGIRKKGEHFRIGKTLNGIFLDAWVYSEKNIPEPAQLLHLQEGVILCQKADFGEKLLTAVRELSMKPLLPLKDWERTFHCTWLEKMYRRMIMGDVEGDYRRHWMLMDLLETWFSFNQIRFPGSKKAFQWLKDNKPDVYEHFRKALAPDATDKDIRLLLDTVIGAA